MPNSWHDVLKEYSDIFEGLGCIRKEYHLFIDPAAIPHIDPPRRIPHAIRDEVKKELDRMVSLGVIAKQEKPTPWVNSMTVVRKPGKIRICIDPTKLNQAIRRAQHPTTTIEEISARMPGAKFFSKIDANAGYWQIQLDDESSKICTFNTPWGRYRFTRLPFGINTSGDAFNETMMSIFQGMDGIQMIVDDILVYGTTQEEHDRRLRAVLQRAREAGLKLNKSKCEINKREVSYVGHTISSEGLKPGNEHVEAITQMPEPTSKEQVRKFLAMVGYLGKFVPNLSQETHCLRQLLSKDCA
jgi:hypothetical protein